MRLDAFLKFAAVPIVDTVKKDVRSLIIPGIDQRFCLAELLAYVQLRMKMILEKARTNETTNRVSLNPREWQSFLDLFSRLTDYYKKLTQPDN